MTSEARENSILSRIRLVAVLFAVSCLACHEAFGSSETKSRLENSNQQVLAEAKSNQATGSQVESQSQAAVSAQTLQVFLPPVLEKNKPAWGTMYDIDGNALSGRKFYVNSQECQTDDYGSFNFIVPVTDKVILFVPDEKGNKIWEITYSSSTRGLLVSDNGAAELVDRLDELALHSETEPLISFAPSIIEPQQTFVVLGKNFSGKQGDDDVELDDRRSDLIAASPRSIVAISDRFLKIGPIKELKVSCRDLVSLPTEIDVSRAELRLEDAGSAKRKLKLSVLGTTLPAVISLANEALSSQMRFGGWRLGRQNIFLSPGGMQNSFAVDVDSNINSSSLSAHILPNGVFDPYSLKTNANLLSKTLIETLERAEIIRLKRRDISLEAQQAALSQDYDKALKSGNLNLEEDSKLNSGKKSLSARMFRVEKMLQARRAVLESEGAKEEYQKLVEAAATSMLGSLDSIVAGKDLGFTEARLLKVVGRKNSEEQQKQMQLSSSAYIPQYNPPPAAFLQNYRKKFGKRSYVPPPPQSAALVPPPAPYRPDPYELGPFLTELKTPPAMVREKTSKSAKGRRSKKNAETGSAKLKEAGSKSCRSRSRTKLHTKAKLGWLKEFRLFPFSARMKC